MLFFARHPRTLLISEQLAVWLGYELKQIAGSLDVLMAAGLLTRTQNPTHAARLYVFAIKGPNWRRRIPARFPVSSRPAPPQEVRVASSIIWGTFGSFRTT
ncbi:MAG: hypothetical protein ACRD09_08465 [Vicinamibacterales bacterium]